VCGFRKKCTTDDWNGLKINSIRADALKSGISQNVGLGLLYMDEIENSMKLPINFTKAIGIDKVYSR
jgi:hypothetical protein